MLDDWKMPENITMPNEAISILFDNMVDDRHKFKKIAWLERWGLFLRVIVESANEFHDKVMDEDNTVMFCAFIANKIYSGEYEAMVVNSIKEKGEA